MKKRIFGLLLGALLMVGLSGCPATGGSGTGKSDVVGTWKLAMMVDTADPTNTNTNVAAENNGRLRKDLTFGELNKKGYGDFEYYEERYMPDREPLFDPVGVGYTVDDNGTGISWSWRVVKRVKGYYSLAAYVVNEKSNTVDSTKEETDKEDADADAAVEPWMNYMDTNFDVVVTHEERLYWRPAVVTVVENGVSVTRTVRDTTGRAQYEYQTVNTEIDPSTDMILIRGALSRTELDDLLVHWYAPDLVEDEETSPWKAAVLWPTNEDGPVYNGGVEGVENYHRAWGE